MTATQPVTPGQDPAAQLAATLSRAAGVLLSAGSIDDALRQVIALAVDTIEGCDFAGVFLLQAGQITTRVSTEAVVLEIDALQRHTKEGPSLDAIGEGGTVYSDDLAAEPRWTTFAPQAVTAGVRSVLAIDLQAKDVMATLNLYGRYPRAFGVIDRAKGLVLASLAGLAFATPDEQEDEARRRQDVAWALSTQEVIGKAQGILMEREHINSAEAFDILLRASDYLTIKLRQVAENLIDTGISPQTGPITTPPGQ